jgi:serine/threonine protein kinase
LPGFKPPSSSLGILPIAASASGALFIVFIFLVLLVFINRRRKRNRAIDFAHARTDTMEMVTVGGLLKNQLSPYELSHSCLTVEKQIGQGEFGVVMKAVGVGIPNCDSSQAVAIKIMREDSGESESNAFLREAVRLKELSHDNVIRLLGVCISSAPYYIVLEYMPYGDLKTLLRQCQTKGITLYDEHLLSFAMDVSCGFEYLQQMRFIHRDLAARNVLISAAFKAKIGDLGMARRTYRSEYYSASDRGSLMSGKLVLPMRWMAPESYFDGTWDLKSDVWMFGVLLWGLHAPFTFTVFNVHLQRFSALRRCHGRV